MDGNRPVVAAFPCLIGCRDLAVDPPAPLQHHLVIADVGEFGVIETDRALGFDPHLTVLLDLEAGDVLAPKLDQFPRPLANEGRSLGEPCGDPAQQQGRTQSQPNQNRFFRSHMSPPDRHQAASST